MGASVRRDLGGGPDDTEEPNSVIDPHQQAQGTYLTHRRFVHASPARWIPRLDVVYLQARGRITIACLMHGVQLLPQSKKKINIRHRSSAETAAVNEASHLRVA